MLMEHTLYLAYKDISDVSILSSFLKEKGYKIMNKLDKTNIDKHNVPAVAIEVENKLLRSVSITTMSCWCNSNRKPLYIEEFINLYERIIIQEDYEFYDYLTRENYLDENRPGGGLYSFKDNK